VFPSSFDEAALRAIPLPRGHRRGRLSRAKAAEPDVPGRWRVGCLLRSDRGRLHRCAPGRGTPHAGRARRGDEPAGRDWPSAVARTRRHPLGDPAPTGHGPSAGLRRVDRRSR
jgi:hypothetical protein